MNDIRNARPNATRWARLLALALTLYISGATGARTAAAAQTMNTAELSGTVRDSTGAILPGARVVALRPATDVKVERTADQEGRFFFPSLAVGEYEISAELAGFKRSLQREVSLQVGQAARVDFVLSAGNISEQIEVEDSELLLKTQSAEISDVIEERRVAELPLNGRQFIQLAQLSEGVVKPPGGTRGAALQQAGDLVNIAGQRSGHNIYLVDGVKVTDEYFNNLVLSPSIDAIQEFKIQKSMYAAEFGGKASALINVATKSGTSEYHGRVFEFLRNDVFDAKNYFDAKDRPIPPFRQNQFGAVFGGPLEIPVVSTDDHPTFFFASYEGQRVRRSVTKTFTVPTAALRAGDFSGFAPIYDPLSTDASGDRTQFANNRIPLDRIDPLALALLDLIPLPNRPGNVQNLVSALQENTDMDQFSVRLDRQLTDKDNLFGRFSFYNVDAYQPFGTSVLNESLVPGFGRELSTRTYNVALSHTHAFTSSVVNEVRFGFLNVSGGQRSEHRGLDFASTAGLLGVTSDPRDVGYPQVSFGGLFSTIGDPTTFVYRDDTSYEVYDNLLWVKGAHKIKFGGYYFHLKFNPENPEAARGVLSYTNRFTSSRPTLVDGNAFADFLLGAPTSAQVGIGRGDERGRTNWLHLYVQDDWQVSPRLAVNAGLRYEINQHMHAVDNRLSAIDLSVPGGRFVVASDENGNIDPSAAALLPLLPIPYVTSAELGWDPGLLQPDHNRFAPRLGFAYRVPKLGDTVVRAGFGVYLNQWAYSVQQALARNLPFFLVKSVNTTADAPRPPFDSRTILASNANGTIGGNNMDYDYRIEYNEAWSLAVQHLLTPSTSVEVSYLGSRTVGADSSSVRNVPVPGPGPIGPRRPVPALSNFNSIRWDGYSTYHAVTFKVERRALDGLVLNANYTLSKSIDDASDPGGTTFESNLPQNVYDQDAEKALSSFDHKHRLAASFVYPLPFGRGGDGWVKNLVGGWQTSGIVIMQSGAPFTVNLGVDQANIGAGPAQRPNLVGDPNDVDHRSPERWFNTDAFELPALYTFGNAGRNIVYAPGYANVDMALQKEIGLTERVSAKFRVEAFNLFNHPNFDVPNRIAFTPNFGRIFSADASRQIQLGVKLEF